jgi:hypothetical protein
MGNKKQEVSKTICPICNEQLSAHARGKSLHAIEHGISAEELAKKLEIVSPVCLCGCNKETQWKGWSLGFSKFLRGHMSKDARNLGKEKLRESLKNQHWARGLTKETSEIIKVSSKKISNSLKLGFLSGNIAHWSLGKTSKTDERIASSAKKRSATIRGKNHWHFMNADEVVKRINDSLCSRFNILSELDLINYRANNVAHHIEIQCKKCFAVTFPSIYDIIRHDKKSCLRCNESGFASLPQKEIEEFVIGLLPKEEIILSSDRTNTCGFELDIFVPRLSFAIEFNGLYWHSSAIQQNKNYHNEKTESCKNNGITLLHIFHDEWRDKRQIVESMIINKLHLSKKIGARKCSISKISLSDSKDFFENNHLDGNTSGFITYGLIFENSIIAAMKIRKPHSKRWRGFLEIARFACHKGINAVGSHSRLLNHVIKHHDEKIVSYVDTRFGGGGEYCEKSGMQLDHVSKHSFWWTDRENRFNRLHCKATKEKSEASVATSRKLLKIWGCANLVFVTV